MSLVALIDFPYTSQSNERESESNVEETNTESPNRIAQAEEDDVWMLYDMFENLLLETKE